MTAGRLLTTNDGERIRSFEYDYAYDGGLPLSHG